MTDAFGDEPEISYTKDDEAAERMAGLALLFMNSRAPLTGAEVARKIYPGRTKSAADRAFNRDRKTLEECGVVIASTKTLDGEDAYAIDERLSFADGKRLTKRDALVLDVACRPLAADPSFALSDELAMALAKVNNSFSHEDQMAGAANAGQDRTASAIRSAFLTQHVCHIVYEDAKGKRTERDIAPFGMFRLRGTSYVVAATFDDRHWMQDEEMRTFNTDRVISAKVDTTVSYQIPPDFYVDDFIRLPFQIGPAICDGTFLIPPGRMEDVVSQTRGGAHIAQEGEGGHLYTHVSDIDAAAAWAIAEGLRPEEPQELVDAWLVRLGEAVDNGNE